MAETAEDKERAARAADEAAAAWADRLHNPKTAARFTRLAVQLRREAAALRGAVGDLTCPAGRWRWLGATSATV